MTDYTEPLRSLMAQAYIPSFRALAQKAKVSSWQIRQLRQGQAEQMRLSILVNISQALQISVDTLLRQCSSVAMSSLGLSSPGLEREPYHHQQTSHPSIPDSQHQSPNPQHIDHQHIDHQPIQQPIQQPKDLTAEYQRLHTQLETQKQDLQQDFQRTSLGILESWMTYWPAAVYATKANPDLPATRLIPLVRPVEKLLEQWGVEAIAPVGSEIPYNPQYHQLIEGQVNPGDRVKVSNPGYFHDKAVIQRANVKPIR